MPLERGQSKCLTDTGTQWKYERDSAHFPQDLSTMLARQDRRNWISWSLVGRKCVQLGTHCSALSALFLRGLSGLSSESRRCLTCEAKKVKAQDTLNRDILQVLSAWHEYLLCNRKQRLVSFFSFSFSNSLAPSFIAKISGIVHTILYWLACVKFAWAMLVVIPA